MGEETGIPNTKKNSALFDKILRVSGCQRESFPDSLEWLYRKFSQKQKTIGLDCFMLTAIIYSIYMIVVSMRFMYNFLEKMDGNLVLWK